MGYSDVSYNVDDSDNVSSIDDFYSDISVSSSGSGNCSEVNGYYLTINDIQNLQFGETIWFYSSNSMYKNYYTHIGGLSGLMEWDSCGVNVQFTFDLFHPDYGWNPLTDNGLYVPANRYLYEFHGVTPVGCNGYFYY
jgi:hypothetical protein